MRRVFGYRAGAGLLWDVICTEIINCQTVLHLWLWIALVISYFGKKLQRLQYGKFCKNGRSIIPSFNLKFEIFKENIKIYDMEKSTIMEEVSYQDLISNMKF